MTDHKTGDHGGPEGPARHALCESFSGLLARAADGSLPPETQPALDAHLRTCAACRNDAADQRAMRTLLQEADIEGASAGFEARVMAVVRAEAADTVTDTVQAGPASWLSHWLAELDARRWTWRLVPVAAALALVAMLVAPTSAANTATTTPGTATSDSATVDTTTSTDALPVSAAVWSESVSEASLLSLMLSANADDTLGNHRNQEPQ